MKETWLNLRKIIFLTSLELPTDNIPISADDNNEIQDSSTSENI